MIAENRLTSTPNIVRLFLQLIADVDWWLVAATVFLLGIGLTTLSYQGNVFYDKQFDFLIVGSIAAIVFWRTPYQVWTDRGVLPVIYLINIALLIAVMVMGRSAMGAQRWLSLGPITLQPSEIAKIVVIFTLSAWLAFHPIRRFKDCFVTAAIILIPAFLVFKQPDLGTSLTFGAIFLGMTFWSGATFADLLVLASPVISLVLNAVDQYFGFGSAAKMTNPGFLDLFAATSSSLWLSFILLLGVFLALFWRRRSWSVWLRLAITSLVILVNLGVGEARPHLWGVLKEYQQKRLTSFVNPYADPRGSGYHILQSLIAIGSGGVQGSGLGKGNQSQGQFIPERHTDFIFAVIGEELGFRFTAAIVFAYALICIRAIMIAYNCREDPRGSLMAIGIMCMFLFHAFLNIGMTIGIMPVAGVPLPFLSYGGTALIIDLIAIGLLMSIRRSAPPPKKDFWWNESSEGD